MNRVIFSCFSLLFASYILTSPSFSQAYLPPGLDIQTAPESTQEFLLEYTRDIGTGIYDNIKTFPGIGGIITGIENNIRKQIDRLH